VADTTWKEAAIDVFPLGLAVFPWGFLCGSLALQVGLDAWQAQALSFIVFAGAVQLSTSAMLGAGAPFPSIFGAAFIISSRHILYSANFRQFVSEYPLWRRALLAFLLTDEMYALASAREKRDGAFCPDYAFMTGFLFFIAWNIATVGILVSGELGEANILGLDFTMAATFIALLMPMIDKLSIIVCVFVSAFTAVLAESLLLPNALVLAALTGMVAGYGSGLLGIDELTRRKARLESGQGSNDG
jgi:predicted branched-subunit amino acid permease